MSSADLASSSVAVDRRWTSHLRGDETILLIEDQPAVRAAATRCLRHYGYRVLEASGEDAIGICQEHIGPIHVVLSDVVLPGTNGRELAGRIGAMRREARLILMSGHTDDMLVRRGVLDDAVPFIQKPFSAESLAAKVREVLRNT